MTAWAWFWLTLAFVIMSCVLLVNRYLVATGVVTGLSVFCLIGMLASSDDPT